MKPHPRIRKTIMWAGAASTALLVVAWIGSGRYLVRWDPAPGWATFTECGTCRFVYAPKFFTSASRPFIERRAVWADTRPAPFQLNWTFRVETYGSPNQPGGRETNWTIPLWAPVALVCLITGLAWRLDFLVRRRMRLNLCPRCHYDRAGLAAAAVCPECGTGGAPA